MPPDAHSALLLLAKKEQQLTIDDLAIISESTRKLGIDAEMVVADVAQTLVPSLNKSLQEMGFALSVACRFPRYPIGFERPYLPAPLDVDPPGQKVRGIPAFFIASGYDPQGQGYRLLYLHNGNLVRFGLDYFRTPGLHYDELHASWEKQTPAAPRDWLLQAHRIAELIDGHYDRSQTPRPTQAVRLWYFPPDTSKPA